MMVVKDDIGDVEAILTELATNVVRHAQTNGGKFKILLEYFADRMVITVIDEGEGFSFKDIPEVGAFRSDGQGGLRLGGFGLSILEGLSDRLSFSRTDPHGTTVCAIKNLSYESQDASDHADKMNQENGGMIGLSKR